MRCIYSAKIHLLYYRIFAIKLKQSYTSTIFLDSSTHHSNAMMFKITSWALILAAV